MVKFFTAHKDGTWIESEGELISIPEMPEFQFVIHPYGNEFRVSEFSSGLFTGRGNTRMEAINQANQKLADASTERIAAVKAQARAKAKEREEWIFQQAIKQAEGLCPK
jgi:hypothetical protein